MPRKSHKITERLFYKNVALTRNLSEKGDVSVDQFKAARALLNWSQADLAQRSGYSLPTINNIERGQYEAHSITVEDIIQTFEQAGVQFLDGPGVRIDNTNFRIKCYEGEDALHYLLTKIGLALTDEGGTLYFSGIDETKLRALAGPDVVKLQKKLGKNVTVKMMCHKEQSNGLIFQNMEKKLVPNTLPLIPCCIYKDRVAIVILKNPVHVAIIYNQDLVIQHTQMFEYLWQTAKQPSQ